MAKLTVQTHEVDSERFWHLFEDTPAAVDRFRDD